MSKSKYMNVAETDEIEIEIESDDSDKIQTVNTKVNTKVNKEPFVVHDRTPMKFGKFSGKTHIDVFESNRKYCDWVIAQGEKFYWTASQDYFRNKIHEHKNITNLSFLEFLNLFEKENKSKEELDFLEDCEKKLRFIKESLGE